MIISGIIIAFCPNKRLIYAEKDAFSPLRRLNRLPARMRLIFG
jgi:hypothetical protein